MDEQHIQARLIALLRQDNIRLWMEPFTTDSGAAERQKIEHALLLFRSRVTSAASTRYFCCEHALLLLRSPVISASITRYFCCEHALLLLRSPVTSAVITRYFCFDHPLLLLRARVTSVSITCYFCCDHPLLLLQARVTSAAITRYFCCDHALLLLRSPITSAAITRYFCCDHPVISASITRYFCCEHALLLFRSRVTSAAITRYFCCEHALLLLRSPVTSAASTRYFCFDHVLLLLLTALFISCAQELALKYAPVTGFSVEDVMLSLETIRSDTSRKDEGNKQFKETSVATLELHLPKEGGEKKKRKVHLKTKLDITTQELKKQISDEFGFKHFNLILSGKKLTLGMRLEEQNVKNNSKIMVLNVSSEEVKNEMREDEEKKRSQDEGVQRTQKGFQILSERDGSEDPATTPFLEIADQRGNPLQIPDDERKALILAMGFHEKGRALMKKRDHSAALCHLLLADEQFNKCNSALLNTVDNYAVLQLDIVWCYQALEQLDCLNDARQRLARAEECFQRCYGEQQSRLRLIKGHTGGEDVLFLRLYLLQSVLAYHEGNKNQASHKLKEVELLFGQLHLEPDKIMQLMSLGFSEQDARLGLRACRGDLSLAVEHITQRKKVLRCKHINDQHFQSCELRIKHVLMSHQERKEMKEREREKRRRRLQDINTLVELGYSKRDAARALHQARGDVDKAYNILLDGTEAQSSDRQTKLDQLVSYGFPLDVADSMLRLMGDDLEQATQMLLDHQGAVPPELLSPSPPSSSSEEPSTSSDCTVSSSSPLDEELVNEVLEDIPRHEEDYLDVTLDEEQELMIQIRSRLDKQATSSG
ncbi:NEDD8 ultimate buster 1 [Anabarilius grahami]|uniref:NEDD8 ultimate buster 1 n=1 Tax=Anabarilius grahami TaxID=495550 RepID=A0A3N0XKF2_ANAGA|nr:NEDD8 ultimate buster 1 [Anabarilius grahami]